MAVREDGPEPIVVNPVTPLGSPAPDRERGIIHDGAKKGAAAAMETASEAKLSGKMEAFLNNPKREDEHKGCVRAAPFLVRVKMPSFEQCWAAIMEKGNNALNAIGAITTDQLIYVVSAILDDSGKVISYEPGLIEGSPALVNLRDERNQDNIVGAHYDLVYEKLTALGLSLPNLETIRALATNKSRTLGGALNVDARIMLNMGKRVDDEKPVPFAVTDSKGNWLQNSLSPTTGSKYIEVRPYLAGKEIPAIY